MSQSSPIHDSKPTTTLFDKLKEGLGFKNTTHDDSISTPPPSWDTQRHVYVIGGGIGNLSAAAFLIRDGNVPGHNITIFENSNVIGGSLDASGNPQMGYHARGGRMFTNDHYECTWGLFRTIPSITHPDRSVYDDTMEFNEKYVAHSQARVVDMNRHRVDVTHLGFTLQDRIELLKLMESDESKLGNSCITDHLSPSFFTTNFWYMWATTFAFQPWHSSIEFKRYLNRFILEFSRIETLAGVKRTVYNQYDSLVTPLITWLQEKGVRFQLNTTVMDMQLTPTNNDKLAVTGMDVCTTSQDGNTSTSHIDVNTHDLVFFTNASMTDASSFGTMNNAPTPLTKIQSGGWSLWESLVSSHPTAGFGNPSVFNSSIIESCWESFTITLSTSKHSSFFQRMEQFSGNKAGTGGLVTFKDSRWFMSIVLYHQPHFVNQPEDVHVFWGYALHPERVGDFVAKPMSQCNGAEILHELCGHLNFDFDILGQDAICLPCRMPYITSMFMPRTESDRPSPVPVKSHNLAFVSQFVEIPLDVVFTVEYSIRVAQIAVYQLLGIQKQIPPIHRHDQMMGVKLQTLIKSLQ